MQPHAFWQEVHPPASFPDDGPFETFYPARFADGRQLRLPIRPLPDGRHALASLIINQAGFAVVEALAKDLAERIAPLQPDVVVGLPTLGLTLAAAFARHLGHTRYVPLGTSRKFWYEETLSVPLTSITTPEQAKRLYVDPRMLPLIEGRRVVLVDDVISSGSSIVAGLRLLDTVGVAPIAIGAAMLQSTRWHAALDAADPAWRTLVHGVLETPMLTKGTDGRWQ
ncbi:adenine/guanine phosphoribosyltransferase-like PRPP-binding protein [Neorhizobium galegae]|uniref:phosphoribosyltransferase n=1 Tax=Neorhizobium galegae TaxID=399 RepID=UPI001AE3B341|nr:phosphoribosyltransferase [Neorhizobium galegae]MBP2549916.1 adenine/guanine phosphoribosyltransferase-like PRPP-binding protein [Neorhizobium galegae]